MGDALDPTYFLVTSPGYTATRWLALALNRHPAIACSHSAGTEPSDGEYTLTELRELAQEKFDHRDETSALSFLRQLAREHPTAGAVGNVHRFSLTALNRHIDVWPEEVPSRVVNLIRHPVSWVASGAAQLGRMFQAVPMIRLRLRRQFWNRIPLYRELGVPQVLEPDELAFCYLCRRMEHLASERADQRVSHIKMEQMTGNVEVFASLFRRVTDLEPEEEYLRQVFLQPPVHRHSPEPRTGPTKQFAAWPHWKQSVFLYWLERSGLLKAYANDYPDLATLPSSAFQRDESLFSLRPFTSNRDLEDGFSAVDEATLLTAINSYTQVRATTLPLFFLEPSLASTRRRLNADLTLINAVNQTFPTVISPGLTKGALPLVEEDWWSGRGCAAAFVHPDWHDRSPAIVVRYSPVGPVWYLNLKGAGIRRHDYSFVQRDGRYPTYQRVSSDTVDKPVDILVDRPGDEPLSHALIGGARWWAALMEVRHALGWHRLLYKIDGHRADTCVPVRIRRYKELPSPGEEGSKVATWDFFTSPRWMSVMQLEQMLNDTPSICPAKKRFRHLLQNHPGRLEKSRKLRRTVGTFYLLRMQPVVYEHLSRGKLRVGHLWKLCHSDAEIERSLIELNIPNDDSGIASLLRRLMLEVYRCNGYEMEMPAYHTQKLKDVSGRFSLLKEIYQSNARDADAMMRMVGGAAGRTLGSLHGGGGHCWGWRIKRRGLDGNPQLDEDGLNKRVGAPSGGATAPRNMTVCGEFVDLSHLYNPATDLVYRVFQRLAPLLKRWLPWVCPRQVSVLQHCDYQLAVKSVTQFAALVLGERTLVPQEEDAIGRLRRERRRREVALKTQATQSEQFARVRKEISELEKQIHRLRLKEASYGANPSLEAFRTSYVAYSTTVKLQRR